MPALPSTGMPPEGQPSPRSGRLTPTPAYTAAAHRLATTPRQTAERALAVLLDAALDPIVDMVLLARDGAYEARSHDGWVRFRRTEPVPDGDGTEPDGYEVVGSGGADPLADRSTDQFTPLADELAHPHPHRTRERLPLRVRPHRPALRPPGRPRPLRHPLGGAQLGGPGRPPRRARLARDRAGPGAVRARGQGRPQRRLRPAAGRLVDVAPTVLALLGCPPDAGGAYLAGQDGDGARRRARRRRPAARATSSCSCSTAPTRTSSTTWPRRGEAPNVARLIEMGTAYELRRDGGPPDRSRSPTTRRS